MKYFIDTEFIEGFEKPLFGKRRHFIDLISIGIVAEDGRTYYAISNEYNYNDADEWVKSNVIIPMYQNAISGDRRNFTDASTFHKAVGKSNKDIAEEVEWFIRRNHHINCNTGQLVDDTTHTPVEFYGYYADYDWVLFCSLFGRMIDLPKGFPMYCIDLNQMMYDFGLNKEWKQENCPDPVGEHNALIDAKWNKELYDKIILGRVVNRI
jgi:hypothetical protein